VNCQTLLSAADPLGGALRRSTVLLVLAAGLAGCSGDKAEPQQPARRPAVPVGVAAVEQKTVAVQIQAIGSVEAYTVVSVRAQVGGELLRVHFKEGQDVKKGELLFTIDPRPFEASLAQAEATRSKDVVQVQQARAVLERDRARINQSRAAMLRDQTQASNAEVQAKRYEDLLKRGLIAQEQYDGLKTTADSLNATIHADEADIKSAEETVRADEAAIKSAEETVRADEAAVENAKLQLSYANIRAPIDGRTGSLMLHEGNIVRAGGTSDSTLVVINQVQPIYVSFTVPQQQLPVIKRYMAEGKLTVTAIAPGDPQPMRGVVTFIDNAVDATTGTIRLKATFSNEDKRLWPGQFVNVALTLATEADAIVIPAGAVQAGQQGQQYVFVVKPDATVEARPVVVARTQGNESIISKGLSAGESVVVDGQTRLVGGAKVEVRGKGGRSGDGDASKKGAGSAPKGEGAPQKAGAPKGDESQKAPGSPKTEDAAQKAGAPKTDDARKAPGSPKSEDAAQKAGAPKSGDVDTPPALPRKSP
jgi:multidrug efflux system membrane fusion protein